MVMTAVKPRAQELHARLSPDLYKEAYRHNRTLSAHLEMLDPSAEYKDGLDAFERQLKMAEIITRSDPSRGLYASTFGDSFDKSAQARLLLPEWMNRISRQVQHSRQELRAIQTSDFAALGTIIRPYAEASEVREYQVLATIPIAELVAITTPVVGDAYKAAYFTDPAAGTTRLVRISQGAQIPTVTVTAGERTVRLHKYGRGIEVSYELLRRSRLDMVAFWVRRVAAQMNADKLAAILDVIINGDGNAGTAAATHNLTALDAVAVAGTLTLKGWLAFKLKFADPYMITTIMEQEAVTLQLQLLNVGSANVPLVNVQGAMGLGSLAPINNDLRDNVRFGTTSEAPALKIVGIDRRFALERVVETGADIDEVERYASRQTQALYLTETEGYAVIDPNANKILDVNA